MMNRSCCTLSLIGIVAIAQAAVADAALIQFRPTASIASPVIRLGDVADIRDFNPDTVQRLSGIVLAPTPASGRQSRLGFEEIRSRLQASGLSLRDLDFSGANAVVVTAIRSPHLNPRKKEPKKAMAQPRPVGSFVVAAKYTVPKGHVLKPDDLVFRRSSATQAMFVRAEDVVGRETTHSLSPEAPIMKSAIREILLVRPNDIVTVYSRAPGISIKRVFKARGTGAEGDVITLATLDNRDKIQARVIGFQEAEVIDSQPSRPTRYGDATGTIQFRPVPQPPQDPIGGPAFGSYHRNMRASQIGTNQ
jgi:flagella basal body P-ring formation protein FlgA